MSLFCTLFIFLLLCLLLASSVVIITERMLLKLNNFIVTISVCLSFLLYAFCQFSSSSCNISCSSFFFCTICYTFLTILQHSPLKSFGLPQPLHVLLYARHCLSSCANPQYLHHYISLLGVSVTLLCIALVLFCILFCLSHQNLCCLLTCLAWISGIFGYLCALPQVMPVHL